MSFRTKLRRASLVLLILAILNGPFVLWVVYSPHLGVSEPDSSHTFSISLRSGSKRFFAPLVGVYVMSSGVLGCVAIGSLILGRLVPETADD